MKQFYRACLNQSLLETSGFDAFNSFLSDFYGGWPLIQPLVQIRRDYVTDLAKYMKIAHFPLLTVSVSVDPKNSSLYKLTVSQPGWFFTKSYYNDSTIMKAYRDLIVSIAENFDAKNLNSNYTNEVDAIIDLEKQLSKSLTPEQDFAKMEYKEYTISELDQMIPQFNWKQMIIEDLYGSYDNLSNLVITNEEKILVFNLDYIQEAAKIFYNQSQSSNK